MKRVASRVKAGAIGGRDRNGKQGSSRVPATKRTGMISTKRACKSRAGCVARGAGSGVGRPAPKVASVAGRRRSRPQDEDEDDDEATDDEDSDDEEREMLEDRLGKEEEEEERECTAESLKLDERAAQAPHLVSAAKAVKYQIAIPTHGRWRPVTEMTGKKRFKGCSSPFILVHTLSFLARQRIPADRVTLFVADKSEAERYRKALRGSSWENVAIVISALGNKANRNFIFTHFPRGTYVVSIDDDVERISWKFRDGITHHCLHTLPAGGFETLIFDAYQRMVQKGAFLWGLNTSQNPRHMRSFGVSVKNGLVNGYLNGFISRPECTELLRVFADATEDSEFSVRHYAKDGVVLRYRMYAGITSPYLNRGGLQEKFEASGERITAAERSDARKMEERWGAMELHRLFPKLIGPPRPRKDKKTMEVVFHTNGYPPGEGIKRRMIAPALRDEDRIAYAPNPKVVGSHSYKLYERYKTATTVAEARKLGARPIDFAFDSNWGYLTVTNLSTAPRSSECVLADSACGLPRSTRQSSVAKGAAPVKVRVKEMSEGHQGLAVDREDIVRLLTKCRGLTCTLEESLAAVDGPFSKVPLEIFRVLLHWAQTGKLSYARAQVKALHMALKACGEPEAARGVKQLEVAELRAERARAKAEARRKKKAVAGLEHRKRKACTMGGRCQSNAKNTRSSRGRASAKGSR